MFEIWPEEWSARKGTRHFSLCGEGSRDEHELVYFHLFISQRLAMIKVSDVDKYPHSQFISSCLVWGRWRQHPGLITPEARGMMLGEGGVQRIMQLLGLGQHKSAKVSASAVDIFCISGGRSQPLWWCGGRNIFRKKKNIGTNQEWAQTLKELCVFFCSLIWSHISLSSSTSGSHCQTLSASDLFWDHRRHSNSVANTGCRRIHLSEHLTSGCYDLVRIWAPL